MQSLRDKLHAYELKFDEQQKRIDDLEQEVFVTKVNYLSFTIKILIFIIKINEELT